MGIVNYADFKGRLLHNETGVTLGAVGPQGPRGPSGLPGPQRAGLLGTSQGPRPIVLQSHGNVEVACHGKRSRRAE